MKFSMKILAPLFFLPLFAVFFSCSAGIDGVVREGGAADISLKTSLASRTQALIRSLRGFMGGGDDSPILDGPAMAKSLAAAPGVRTISLKNTGSSSLEGNLSLSNVGNFLSAEAAKSRFITYAEGQGAGASSINIALDRNSAPDVISRLAPEIEDYLSALMAPVVTGETSTTQEYLDLVASVYSRALADEIAAARIRLSIEFPRAVTAVQGGTASGKRAEFEVPLVDILVLEHPLLYVVSW